LTKNSSFRMAPIAGTATGTDVDAMVDVVPTAAHAMKNSTIFTALSTTCAIKFATSKKIKSIRTFALVSSKVKILN